MLTNLGLSSSCWDHDSPAAAETVATSSWLCSWLDMGCSLCWAGEGDLISLGWTGLRCGVIRVHRLVKPLVSGTDSSNGSQQHENYFFSSYFSFLEPLSFCQPVGPTHSLTRGCHRLSLEPFQPLQLQFSIPVFFCLFLFLSTLC